MPNSDSSDIKYWQNRRYTAWFTPEFDLDSVDASHAEVTPRIERLVERIAADIFSVGLLNPIQVVIKNGVTTVHPGKCRVAALKKLGRRYAPAIVVNYDLPGGSSPAGTEFLSSKAQVEAKFTADVRVEMSHRHLTTKKVRESEWK